MNRLVQVTDPRYNVIKKYVYDLKGNVIKEINEDGYKSGSNDEESYVGEKHTISFSYDKI